MKKVIFIALFAVSLFSHDLTHKVTEQKAVVLSFSFGSSEDFSYQPYEVFAPGEKIPFAVGRTDKLSRVVFVPDRAGIWLIKVISEDGHGKEVEVKVGEDFEIKEYSKTNFEKFQKIFVGIALIFAIFIFLQYFIKRRER